MHNGKIVICMQLDDWVLCRIRQKGNKSKNEQEVQQNPSELLEYLPRIENLPSVYIDDGRDMIADYFLSNGCHLIASLFNEHDQPNMEDWCMNFQPLTKMIYNEHKDEDLLSGNMVAAGDTNLYIQHISGGGKISSNQSNVIMNLQHLDRPTVSENFFTDRNFTPKGNCY